ncbi:MAG: zf-HC2 domain-containing protein [Terracidiphilus sp.]|jgi:hypothetical protein
MAAERYLLNELAPEAREAFEEHFFGCPQCALDLRAGVAFVEEAKVQLPRLTRALPSPIPFPSRKPKLKLKRDWWISWLQPAFAAPVFATLLLVIGYQNLVTYPALRAAVNQPRLLSSATLHGATRGAHQAITADRRHGVALPILLPEQPSTGAYTSFSVDLMDPQGKLAWTGSIAAPAEGPSSDQPISLVIPGAMLRSGAYTVAVSGVGPHGEHTVIDQYLFDLHLID